MEQIVYLIGLAVFVVFTFVGLVLARRLLSHRQDATIISDTSVASHLAQIRKLRLLRDLYGIVIVPERVWQELSHDIWKVWVWRVRWAGLWWLHRETVPDTTRVSALMEAHPCLDRGEAEALVLALSHRHVRYLLIDELYGRRVAHAYGIPYIGVLGILIEAKAAGKIQAVRPLMDELRRNRFRISDALYRNVCSQAGE